MASAWDKVKPKDQFKVKLTADYNAVDQQTLTLLYQPLIGMSAYSLLLNLNQLAKVYPNDTVIEHSTVLTQLDIGLPQFFEARSRLEAVGLLKTYARAIDEGHHFIYVLMPPVSPMQFLTDDVMSLLLLDKIGETSYKSLVAHFSFDLSDLSSYQNVSRTFVDVFSMSNLAMSQDSEELIRAKKQFKAMQEITSESNVEIDNPNFDWVFFKQLIKNLPIKESDIDGQLKNTIDSFHHLYGINELEMQKYVMSAIDFVTNEIKIKELKQYIYRDYHGRKKQIVSPMKTLKAEGLKTEAEVETFRKNTLKRENYSEQEIAVILACEKTPPLVFLKAVKEQKGGFVASNERWTIETIVNQSKLPNSVINMLIHYLLVVKKETSLNQNLVSTIANDWVQKKLFTPEEALSQVKGYQKQTKARTSSKRGPQSKRKETLPEWAQSEEKRVETPVSKEEQAYFAEQLKRLNQSREEETS
ncbi:replication initiation and membrane attachment family protein [Vagococcus silagei]|uniref:Uncharacterized protein n=1 Tax=Vagococcus silagei TaxID=2508885 RepID=A0A4S3B5F3_9ENTE|nr:DnaD domain protein [Vagococcus silagei]THB61758.1 hypothetical protein ESZ54_03690 [Vagococcus silagei]